MMDTKKLRQKVLDLAIHGKLVKQDPNDEPASILLDRIRKEKVRLVGEGKLKKKALEDKPFSEVEIPFEIPKGWIWVRLYSLCSVFSTGPFGSAVHKADYVIENGIPIVNPANIKNGRIIDDKIMLVSKTKAIELDSFKLSEGDILLARRGDLSKCAIVSNEEKDWLCGTGSFFLHIPYIEPVYFKYFYESTMVQSILLQECVGATMDNLNQSVLGALLFPLPPLNEQHRIVKAVNELFGQIDIIEQSEKEINEASDKVRSKVLNLAIQGRLVPQDPNDEPASVLLDKIRKEKERLVKEGKLKKKDLEEKPISEDEIPFDIPEGWEWCRLGSIVDFSKSKSVKPDQIKNNDWVLDLEDIEKGTGRLLQKKRMIDVASKSDKHIFHQGDVLYSKLRPYLNKVIVADEDGYCTSEILVFDFGDIYNKYAQYYLMSSFFVDYAMRDAYGVKMPRVGSSQGNNALFPIPPLPEQRRIVEKIEEILSEIEKLHS